MEFPPQPKTPYILYEEQDKRIFEKLSKLEKLTFNKKDEELIKLLYSRFEDDWRTPLESLLVSY